MLGDEYLVKGITGLARALDHSWNQGHFGCAVIATYFLCHENALDDSTVDGLKVELDKMIESHDQLFAPISITTSQPEILDEIPQALEGNISRLHPGGHNVIYATLALKALKHMPEMINHDVVAGIRRLIEAFNEIPDQKDIQGVDVSGLTASSDDTIPAYSSAESIAEFTFSEILKFEEMYYEIQGVVGHLVTHAQSLIELSRLGYPELAEMGHDAHKIHARRVRLFHDRFDKNKWTPVHPVHHDPLKPSFWTKDREEMAKSNWGYAHFFKYRYHFYDLLKLVGDPHLKERCLERMGDHIMNDFRSQGRKPAEFFVALTGHSN